MDTDVHPIRRKLYNPKSVLCVTQRAEVQNSDRPVRKNATAQERCKSEAGAGYPSYIYQRAAVGRKGEIHTFT